MQKIYVYMTQESLAQFEDAFLDTSSTPEKYIFDTLKEVAKNVHSVHTEGQFACSEYSAVNPQGLTIPIQVNPLELSKHGLNSDEKWRPKNIQKPSAFSCVTGEKMWSMLQKYTEIHVYRLKHWNSSLPKDTPKIPIPSCIEEILQEILFPRVMNKIQDSLDKELDKEFQSIQKT